jgi:hypothetical protein
MDNTSPSALAAATSNPLSLMARLTKIFTAPGDVYLDVKNYALCLTNWWVPALLFVLASLIAAGLIYSQPAIREQIAEVQDRAMQRQFQPQIDSGTMTQAQVDQIKANAGRYSEIGPIIGGVISPIFAAAITPFWGGFVLWVGAMLLFKRPFPYLKGVEAVGLTLVILALGVIVKALLVVVRGDMFASLSPALFLKDFDSTNPLHTMLMSVDVFVIWALTLRAIALAKLSEISLAKAVTWVLSVWLVLTGSMFGFSWAMLLLSRKLMSQG